MNCRQNRKLFIEALYGGLNTDQKKDFDAHLQGCSKCKTEYQKLAATLKVMDLREREQPAAEFWDSFWDKLVDRIDTKSETVTPLEKRPEVWKLPGLFSPQWLFRFGMAAAILLIGIFIGRFLLNPPPQQFVPLAENDQPLVQQTALDARAQNYLERSKLLLLGISNLDEELIESNTVDFDRYQQLSWDLVQETGFLKTVLQERPRQRRLRELVNDLEIILLQIANLEAENDISGIEMVKSGIDRQGILLKINLQEIRRSERKSSQRSKNGESTI